MAFVDRCKGKFLARMRFHVRVRDLTEPIGRAPVEACEGGSIAATTEHPGEQAGAAPVGGTGFGSSRRSQRPGGTSYMRCMPETLPKAKINIVD
jgi:hypothetical protein